MSNKELPSKFQEYIHLSRYARWMEGEGRRETFDETVDRVVEYLFETRAKGKAGKRAQEAIRNAMKDLEVMPSMRAMMTAGKAMDECDLAAYNCSGMTIDHPHTFDEMLYILMHGAGVGYSVEAKFIEKLPVVAEKMRESKTVVHVGDSKEGWAMALRELLGCLYSGSIPQWDVTDVRPAGARLNTFGGRASGPRPLEDLFRFCVRMFKNAKGRRLNSLECHDLCCKIAETVVVGGVRRCQVLDTEVFTTDGWKEIQCIEVGDKVILEGEELPVTNTFDNGVQDIVEVQLEDGTSVKCTPNHRWSVFNHKTGEMEWVEAQCLDGGDYSFVNPE